MRYLLLLCSIVLASNFAGVVIEDGANVSGLVFTSGVTVNTGFTTKLENDMWGSNGFKETIGGMNIQV